MKVIGICGSPRKGNTEWMLRKLLGEIEKSGIKTRLFCLREMDIKGCDGCLACEAGGEKRKGVCKIKDDMQEIYPELLKADCLVLGTPVYFSLLSAMLKNFMDRTCAMWPRLKGKPIAGIAVAEEGIGAAVRNLQTYAGICDMRWVGSVTALSKTVKQVSKDAQVGKRLDRLAKKIVDTIESA